MNLVNYNAFHKKIVFNPVNNNLKMKTENKKHCINNNIKVDDKKLKQTALNEAANCIM